MTNLCLKKHNFIYECLYSSYNFWVQFVPKLHLVLTGCVSDWLISSISHPTSAWKVYVGLSILVCVCVAVGKEDWATGAHSKISNTSWHTHPFFTGQSSERIYILSTHCKLCECVCVFVCACEREGSIIKDKNTCFMIMERLLCVSTTHIYLTLSLIDWPEIRAHANRCMDMHLHNHTQAIHSVLFFGLRVLIVMLLRFVELLFATS